jgi:hypothetical protein
MTTRASSTIAVPAAARIETSPKPRRTRVSHAWLKRLLLAGGSEARALVCLGFFEGCGVTGPRSFGIVIYCYLEIILSQGFLWVNLPGLEAYENPFIFIQKKQTVAYFLPFH